MDFLTMTRLMEIKREGPQPPNSDELEVAQQLIAGVDAIVRQVQGRRNNQAPERIEPATDTPANTNTPTEQPK